MRYGLADRLSRPGLAFRALPLGSKAALLFLAVVALAALFAPWLAPHDPLATGIPAQAPSAANPFGTDRLGRDIYSRLLFGARSSLLIGLGAVALAIAVGAVLGAIAATASKWVSESVMRIMDIIMAFPGIALAAVLLATLGNSVPVIIVAIAVIYIPQLARVVRANVMAQWGEDYVRAEQVLGAGRLHILVRHVVRNTAAPVLVFATVMVADAIIFEASLSFLGAGVQDPAPSWGNVISYGRTLVLNGAWWATTYAGLLILLTVLCLNVLAEGLTDAMVNPRLRKPAKITEKDNTAAAVLRAESGHGIDAASPDAATPPLLAAQLERLRATELGRGDRLHPDTKARPILQVRNLSIRFPDRYGDTRIVDNVSFTVNESETMGLVGESGCGKSITSLAIMGLLAPNAEVTGSIMFEGRELVGPDNRETTREKLFKGLRGEQIAMVYQDALSSLNPSMLIREQMEQLTRRNGRMSPEELLKLVKLDPRRTLRSYPHELSGGQRQRVLIAMALSRSPKLVVADEPTTALDVTVQAQVVDLLNELREQLGFAMVFVSHDLALVASLAHRVTVMYAGQVVESGATAELLADPRHEYTRGLLGAVLSIESGAQRLHQIPGSVPSPRDFAAGDRFAARSLDPAADPARALSLERVGTSDHYWATAAPSTRTEGANA
ncbi:dipeptide/oligopeptide/nickel ABC transporter permease/ATP-binding protein [Paeniglutamicibacter sp. ABSL32-1]|uniref:dipeptide/oligopeptide/nickel ABC transporter permease/ATP-binding protein n=1 Tax=Paeniglutamicibacter quisquiliarum TaxID=2849498 RepID=UPI001C2DC298|nr:dipeptide/oligopeptide/nickel ABC transporter permease/ATP-binding protein [Paeniglutamicibacter quisquiliarum]MBV1779969.1 dipeptide/oligopeptide/nickel ABC transporter permease/ATP-binding protein [Paeniglutamicibacter quisquiliarum]